MDRNYFYKVYGDADNLAIPNRKFKPKEDSIYATQLHEITWDVSEWSRIPRPRNWPKSDSSPWPPTQLTDLIGVNENDMRDYACVNCKQIGSQACSDRGCDMFTWHQNREDWGFHFYLRTVTGPNSGLFARRAIRSNIVVGDCTGKLRPVSLRMPRCSSRRLYASNFPIGPTAKDQAMGILDSFEQCSVMNYINHSCDPNCTWVASRVGNVHGIFVKTLRLIRAHEELTCDWGDAYRKQHQHCRNMSCACGATPPPHGSIPLPPILLAAGDNVPVQDEETLEDLLDDLSDGETLESLLDDLSEENHEVLEDGTRD